jgi:hypothetical protein
MQIAHNTTVLATRVIPCAVWIGAQSLNKNNKSLHTYLVDGQLGAHLGRLNDKASQVVAHLGGLNYCLNDKAGRCKSELGSCACILDMLYRSNLAFPDRTVYSW